EPIGSGQDACRVHRLRQGQSWQAHRVVEWGRKSRPCVRRAIEDDGREMVHVPYRSAGLALTDLLAGQVQVGFPSLPSAIGYVRAGPLRALAVPPATRSQALPDVPSVGEFVPGYEASGWFGVGAPKATPAEIVEKLNKEVNAALHEPKMKARLADLGGEPLT